MKTQSKMIVFHAMKGSQAIAAAHTKITLTLSHSQSGIHCFWKLENPFTGHFWFTEVTPNTWNKAYYALCERYQHRYYEPKKEYKSAADLQCIEFSL